MEALVNHLPQILIFLGLGLLAVEIVVLGFSTFVLFFVGLACLLIGAGMYVGVLPPTMMVALTGIGVLSAVLTLVLWKPLKKMQNKVERKPVKSDVVGYTFALESDVAPGKQSAHRYSGIEWKVLCAESLSAGALVRVTKTEVGKLTVESAAPSAD